MLIKKGRNYELWVRELEKEFRKAGFASMWKVAKWSMKVEFLMLWTHSVLQRSQKQEDHLWYHTKVCSKGASHWLFIP